MAPNPKVKAAYMAMRALGISEDKVKPALKKLLKLYDKNWDFIEGENYRALVDLIFDEEDAKDVEQKHKSIAEEDELEEESEMHELVRPLKRLRSRNQESQGLASPSNCNSEYGGTSMQPAVEHQPPLVQQNSVNKGEQSISPSAPVKHDTANPLQLCATGGNERLSLRSADSSMTRRKDKGKRPYQDVCQDVQFSNPSEYEPSADDVPLNETPLAIILPDRPSNSNSALGKESTAFHNFNGEKGGTSVSALGENRKDHDFANVAEKSCGNVEIVSMSLGEDQSVSGNDRANFRVTNNALNGAPHAQGSAGVAAPRISRLRASVDGSNNRTVGEQKQSEVCGDTNACSLVAVSKNQLLPDNVGFLHNASDITKGEERVRISWVNEVDNQCPPFFHYIPQSLVFGSACLNFSLSEIREDNCCSKCSGDCLPSPVPCACACVNGGEFIYTVKGLVKEAFLQKCISDNRDPQKRHQFYCRECPLESSKGFEIFEPCKGHRMRKFIKECWRKCGCGKYCGNRVAQQGIRWNLQVFMTSEGKGWGLRTLDELPKGAFVCEYVGEILTVKELHKRNLKIPNVASHTYRVLLDSGWSSMTVKGDEALCLDSTSYGNIARFINHRCYDANLIEIPIEVETPKRYYYHVALFTTRKIQALEELTWDYGVEFNDREHSQNAFQCLCGSKFCRNVKRSSRLKKGR